MKKTIMILSLLCCTLLCACTMKEQTAVPENTAAPEPQAAALEQSPDIEMTQAPAAQSDTDAAFFDAVKRYILEGQEEAPEVGKLLWAESFLDAVNFEKEYRLYLDDGGKAEDVLRFAAYLTENAPVPENWKALFEKSLLEDYRQTPTRYEDLGNGVYQVYVKLDDAEAPFVTVNSRTGWYHG